MKFTNIGYKVLKQAALIWLPAIATLYASLAGLWHLGNISEIVGSIAGVDTFLGVVLHLSTVPGEPAHIPEMDSAGRIVIDKSNPLKDVYRLELTIPLEDISSSDSLLLDVVSSK